MQNELRYLNLVNKVLDYGNSVEGRNGKIKTLPFQTLDIELQSQRIPLLTTRKIFYKGIAGEYAALIRGPKNIKDFETFGCNYWSKWADENGNLELDYFRNFYPQMEYIIRSLRTREHNRRLILNFWNEENVLLNKLSLPCCYYSMQFYREGGKLHLLWNQRSADLLVGVPSDIVIAFILLNVAAGKSDLEAGKIKMVFGDAHIYEEHFDKAKEQLSREIKEEPLYNLDVSPSIIGFLPDDLEIIGYKHHEPIKYELKA